MLHHPFPPGGTLRPVERERQARRGDDALTVSRRALLGIAAGAGAAAALPLAPRAARSQGAPAALGTDWGEVRALFDLSPDRVHLSAMLIAAHPRPVREAIERHRAAMDRDPVEYLERHDEALTEAGREAAGRRLGVPRDAIAITESTTMGVGLVYGGLRLREGQEMLTTEQDYYVTHESLRQLGRRTGAVERRVAPFDRVAEASEEGIVARIAEAIRPETRLLALTWVHSNTGLKMPVSAIAAHLAEVNAGRDEQDHVLLGLDAVHGFGVEPDDAAGLGADFLMAGCHKWLFGPRGTGIVAFSDRGLRALDPVIPSFDDSEAFSAWYVDAPDRPPNNGRQMTPGGFKAFEHRWALPEAFALQEEIGVERIAARTRDLASALKEALARVPGVRVVTPASPALSSGIVAFEVEGLESGQVVRRLRERGVIASVAPYPSSLVRLTPSIVNGFSDIDAAAAALQASA